MARRKIDKLGRDIKAASDAGMSYGKWKAMQNPVKIEPPKVGTKFTCECCGKEFVRYDNRQVKYCSWDCHKRYHALKRCNPVEAKVKPCIICGKEFSYRDNRQKYCSDECRSVGFNIYQRKRMKELRAREREKKNA